MVDENLIRKDISFAEMAALAIDYAGDAETAVDDADKAVALLFKSAGYQKRSYIRAFIPLVQEVGADLRFVEQIPRALGLALAKRIAEGEPVGAEVRAGLAGLDGRTAVEEIEVLRRVAGQGDEAPVAPSTERAASPKRPAKAKSRFQFDRPEGRGKCVAAAGRLEIRLERDFTTIDRRRLERAVKAMFDQLDG